MKFGLFNSIAEKTTHWNVVEIKLLFFVVEFHVQDWGSYFTNCVGWCFEKLTHINITLHIYHRSQYTLLCTDLHLKYTFLHFGRAENTRSCLVP